MEIEIDNRDLFNILNEDEQEYENSLVDEDEQLEREVIVEKALSLVDITNIGPDEYLIFLDYAIANIHKNLRSRVRTKIPDQTTIQSLAKDAITLAVSTFDSDKAKESGATFRTHLGWKALQVTTDYAREFNKATKNVLNNSDEEYALDLESNSIVAGHDGTIDSDSDVDRLEEHDTHRAHIEYSKKIEWAMRRVRYELPQENNLVIDVGIGDIRKSNGDPFTLDEWAEYTSQKPETLKKLFRASKRLLKQKMYRRGYMDVVTDDETTQEDFLKDKNIQDHIEKQEESDSIMDNMDIETITEEANEHFVESISVELFEEKN